MYLNLDFPGALVLPIATCVCDGFQLTSITSSSPEDDSSAIVRRILYTAPSTAAAR